MTCYLAHAAHHYRFTPLLPFAGSSSAPAWWIPIPRGPDRSGHGWRVPVGGGGGGGILSSVWWSPWWPSRLFTLLHVPPLDPEPSILALYIAHRPVRPHPLRSLWARGALPPHRLLRTDRVAAPICHAFRRFSPEVQKTEVQKSARNRAFTDWAIGNKYGFGDACRTRQENPELTTLESTPRGCASAEISLDRTRPRVPCSC